MKSLQEKLQDELNESYPRNPKMDDVHDCIQSHLTNAFVEIWDEWGMALTAKEFHDECEKALKDFDIRKMLDWGKSIKEK